jgi:hypothetical protein
MAALQSTWSDTHKCRYILNIYDTEGGGDGVDFDITFGSVIISDEGDDNDPFKRVVPKICTWTMLLNSANYDASTASAVRSFYDELSNSYEGRFFCEVKRNDDSNDVIFRGKILPDVGDLTLAMHEEFKVTAICGLKDLFNIEYKGKIEEGRYNDDPISFIEHFSNILKYNQVAEYFDGQGGPIFSTSQHWTCNFHDGSEDIWAFVHRRHTYYEQLSSTFRRYMFAGDVLTDLLTGFNARIYQSKGVFQIEQISYQDNGTIVRRGYDLSGNEVGNMPVKTKWTPKANNSIKVLTYPVIKRLPPLKAVRLKQNKGYYNVWGGNTLKWPWPNTLNLGPILSEGLQLAAEFRFDVKPVNTAPLRWNWAKIIFMMTIKIGNNYLRPVDENYLPISIFYRTVPQDTSMDNVVFPQLFQWSSTPFTFTLDITWSSIVSNLSIEVFKNLKFWFITDETPENGDLSISIDFVSPLSFVMDPSGVRSSISELSIMPESRIFMSEQGLDSFSLVPDNVTLVEINDVRNTVIYDASLSYYDYGGDILRPDGTTAVSRDILYAGPSQWWITGDWTDPDMSVTMPIQQLFMRSILSMRSLPNKVVNITMIHTKGQLLSADDIYLWDNDVYLPIRSASNLSTGEHTFSLWRLTKDFVDVDVEIDISMTHPSMLPGEPSIYSRPLGGGVAHFQEWLDVNNPFVTPDYDLYWLNYDDEDEIRKMHHLVINGVKQRYINQTDAKPAPDNGEWMIDRNSYDILFFKGRNPVKWIEFTVYQ